MEAIALAIAGIDAWATGLSNDRLAFFYATLEPELSCMPRIYTNAALAYALSPLSLVPRTVPVLGWIDRQLLVPTLLALARASIPSPVFVRARERATTEPVRLQQNANAAIAVAIVWLAAAIALTWLLLASFGTDALIAYAPAILCVVALVVGLALGAYVRAVVFGESIFGETASNALGVVAVGLGASEPSTGRVPLMDAQHAGSGV